MSKIIPINTCKAMISKSEQKLKVIIKRLKSGSPKNQQEEDVQNYSIEHTKIIGWQNRYYVYEECQPNGPIDLIFTKINEEGNLVQYNIDAKGIHPNCNYFPQGKRKVAKDKFKERNDLYERLQSIAWRVEDKNFTHKFVSSKGLVKSKFYSKGFMVFKDVDNNDVTNKIIGK